MNINFRTGIIALLILGLLGLSGFVVLNQRDTPSPNRQELPKENQVGLEEDSGSINTIVYGFRNTDETLIYAVNDSGKNNTLVTIINPDVKFITPLNNGRQLFYIADTNEGDVGGSFEIKTINSADGGVEKIYSSIEGYGIDRYVISENNEWIAWYEVRPEEDEYTHSSDYYRAYKADLGKVLSGRSDKVEAIKLFEIKAAPDVQINIPSSIMNDGRVYYDALIPSSYALHYGFKNEQLQDLLPLNTYNSAPYLYDGKYFLYTSFDPNNAKFPSDGDMDSTREEVINTNIIKTINEKNGEIVTVGPGDNGEQYKHPVYVDGGANGEFKLVSEVYTLTGEGEDQILSQKEIQMITKNPDGTFNKNKIFDTTDGKKYRILTRGDRPNGIKTVLIGEETSFRGNLGTGMNVGSSGYKNHIFNIRVINLDTKEENLIPSSEGYEFEFISMLLKRPEEKIGIDIDKVLADESTAKQEQLQLSTFIPIEPKRVRKNPRSECQIEWEKKGYKNYEACEACPLYIYNDDVVEKITIIPRTPIAKNSTSPKLIDDSWSFTADKNGNLSFSTGNYSKIDYLFPRGKVDMPQEGMVIIPDTLEEKIAEYSYSLGFNTREVKDIVRHFREKLGNFKYVFISTLSDEQTKKLVDFEVYPKPKVFKNIMFYAKKYSSLDEIESNIINSYPDKSFYRKDYTVVAWGSVLE